MILISCQKCRGFVKSEHDLFEVKIQTGRFLENLMVCQTCYEQVSAENYESKLLLENI